MCLFKSPGRQEAACRRQTACCADSACAPSACVTGWRGKKNEGASYAFSCPLPPPASDETVKFLALARLSLRPPTCGRLALAMRDFLHNVYPSLSDCEPPLRPIWRRKWRALVVQSSHLVRSFWIRGNWLVFCLFFSVWAYGPLWISCTSFHLRPSTLGLSGSLHLDITVRASPLSETSLCVCLFVFTVSFLNRGGHVSVCVPLSCVHMHVCLCDCMRAMWLC